MKVPPAETINLSAIQHLREIGAHDEADLLSRCNLEIGDTCYQYPGSTQIGLNITLRCKAADFKRFEWTDHPILGECPSPSYEAIHRAIEAVLPGQVGLYSLSARSLLVDRNEFEKTELERLIEAQAALMIAVATGGPRIQSKNDEYREHREMIRRKLEALGKRDPNPFEDLWAWYGRWSSGDLPSYQSRRDYIGTLYRPLLEDLAGASSLGAAEPSREPTGWERVDRAVDKIISNLERASREEEFQAMGLLCRECLISLAQAVFDPKKHKPTDGIEPSQTDAYRMLEAYFSAEFPGSQNEALRRHAKASLNLANELQHKRTAQYKDAALCAEATRTVVNIVAITSGKR
ncbi:hypothetical protein FJY63_08645 [Candidatus Sumerlaeota bacterium]|nr:hypothetical protein [Candidatus Sumerlaeota bacterium]